jgi:hypothetical protein
VTFDFEGEVWFWKGPAPWYFVSVPRAESRELKQIVATVTYGWGMVPVRAAIGDTEFTTALWEKDGVYIVPVKASVRKAQGIDEGDTVRVFLEVLRGA